MNGRLAAWGALGSVALVLAACAVRPAALHGWVGREAAALEREWGAPSRHVEGEGGRILIYEELDRSVRQDFLNAYQAGPRSIGPPPGMVVIPPPVRVRSYLFWVDASGTVVRAEIRDP